MKDYGMSHEGEIVSINAHHSDKPMVTIAFGEKSTKKKSKNSMVVDSYDDRPTARIPMDAKKVKECRLGDKVSLMIEKVDGNSSDKEEADY